MLIKSIPAQSAAPERVGARLLCWYFGHVQPGFPRWHNAPKIYAISERGYHCDRCYCFTRE